MPEIKFSCMKCGSEIEAETTLAGKVMQCPRCHNALKVPDECMVPGMVLGGYTLEKMLGQGGMGEVWLATQTSMGRKVALKILNPSLSKDKEFIKRFTNEMKMVGMLDHQGIVSAYEAGNANGFYFLATSYVDGETIASMLESGKVFKEKEALEVVKKVAEALKYAWDKYQILHRDIKPANIMIEKGGEVKLMDMGISKSLKEDVSITMTGIIVGTPYYMSPEQAKAERDIDQRADIYSLGATLYHMLTGRLPYDATSAMAILARVISEQATLVRKLNSNVSPECEMLIGKMMSKDKNQRQASWQEVIDDIEETIENDNLAAPIIPEVPENIPMKSDWLMKAGVILIIACFVIVSIALIKRGENRRAASSDIEVKDDAPGVDSEKKTDSAPVVKSKGPPRVISSRAQPSVQEQPADVVKEPKSPAVEIPDTSRKEPGKGATILSELADRGLVLSEKEIEKVAPILKDYYRDLAQLKENRSATFVEKRDKIKAIVYDTKKKVESKLSKERAAILMKYLDDERYQKVHDILAPAQMNQRRLHQRTDTPPAHATMPAPASTHGK
ncbi:MAG: hypothetical protein A2X48_10265 [Lentisphaerae bacterium GWF2_49_21]|nr:MAG: hypothetical protein A2X48_10265 [Lentisphaerae bacterium GWF2_49_21]